jgi:hypothetical protein
LATCRYSLTGSAPSRREPGRRSDAGSTCKISRRFIILSFVDRHQPCYYRALGEGKSAAIVAGTGYPRRGWLCRSLPPPVNGANGRTSNEPSRRRHQKRRPNTRPNAIMTPQHLLATIRRHLAIDHRAFARRFLRPRRVHLMSEGEAIRALTLFRGPNTATQREGQKNQLDLSPSFAPIGPVPFVCPLAVGDFQGQCDVDIVLMADEAEVPS